MPYRGDWAGKGRQHSMVAYRMHGTVCVREWRGRDEWRRGGEREREKKRIALSGGGPMGQAAVCWTKSFQCEEKEEIKERRVERERIRVRMLERVWVAKHREGERLQRQHLGHREERAKHFFLPDSFSSLLSFYCFSLWCIGPAETGEGGRRRGGRVLSNICL